MNHRCYFCDYYGEGCKPYQIYGDWTWRVKIKPRICERCDNQIILIKWLDKMQYRQLRSNKNLERYHANPEKAKKRMIEYSKKNRKRLQAITKNRYHADEEFRRKTLDYTQRYHTNRYHTDPEFRAKRLECSRRQYYLKKKERLK